MTLRKNWQAIAATDRPARKPKGSTKQLELYVPPKPRYAVPENVALVAWKKLREQRS